MDLEGKSWRTQSRTLILGRSLSEFMRKVGIFDDGGALRRRLRIQMDRLFHSTVSLTYESNYGKESVSSLVADHDRLWWEPKRPDEPVLWDNTGVEDGPAQVAVGFQLVRKAPSRGQHPGKSVLEYVLHASVVEQKASNNGAKSGVLFLPNPFQHAVCTRFAETEMSKTLQAGQGVGGSCSETGG